jgi:polysaccharide pyruvyl transferase CsaB
VAERVLIGGYYGFGNLGDEALLFALLRKLREALPAVELVVLSQEPRRTAAAYGVEAINRWNPLAIWHELGRARLFLLGGGGLLQDVTSRRSAFYYLGLLWLARLRQVPAFLLGQGVGPLRSRLLRRLAVRELKRAEYVMVRDELSLRLLREWGADRGQLIRGYDLALTLPSQPAQEGQDLLLVVLREPGRRDRGRARFIAELAAALDEAKWRFGLRPAFLPLFPREDYELIGSLRRAMAVESVVLDPEGLPLPEVLKLFGETKLVLGMRLHALEFALLAGIPFVALSYDPKVEEFVRAVEGLSGLKLPVLQAREVTAAGLLGALEGLWANRMAYRARLAVAAAELGRLADSKLKEALAKLAKALERPPEKAIRRRGQ